MRPWSRGTPTTWPRSCARRSEPAPAHCFPADPPLRSRAFRGRSHYTPGRSCGRWRAACVSPSSPETGKCTARVPRTRAWYGRCSTCCGRSRARKSCCAPRSSTCGRRAGCSRTPMSRWAPSRSAPRRRGVYRGAAAAMVKDATPLRAAGTRAPPDLRESDAVVARIQAAQGRARSRVLVGETL
jgi:hypothetical protein